MTAAPALAFGFAFCLGFALGVASPPAFAGEFSRDAAGVTFFLAFWIVIRAFLT